MNENINIAEILKDAPKGTPLYSTILGECTFDHISGGFIWVLSPKCDVAQAFTKEGYISFKNTWCSEVCCLFPSKHHATWNDFKSPWKHRQFEPFDKVMVQSPCRNLNGQYIIRWIPELYGYWNSETKEHVFIDKTVASDKDIFPFDKNLVGKEVENG